MKRFLSNIFLGLANSLVFSAHATAQDSRALVVHGGIQKPDPKRFPQSTGTLELRASVENADGDWLRDLQRGQTTLSENKSYFFQTTVFTLKGKAFCAQPIQLKVDGKCALKAVTSAGRKAGINNPVKPTWLPAFNTLSMQREFKTNLC